MTDCQKFGNGKGIALRGDSYWIGPWIWGYGGGLVDMAKKQILIGSKQSIAGWSAYNSLFQNKCAFPDKDFSNDYGNVMTAFKNGQVAMIVNGPWSTADVLSGPAFKSSTNFQVAVLPPGPGGQGSPIGGASFVISRNSQHAAEAYTFIKWLTDPAQEAVFASKNNDLPSRVSAYKLPDVKKNRLIVAFLAAAPEGDRPLGRDAGRPALHRLDAGDAVDAEREVRRRRRPLPQRRGRLEVEALPELHRREVDTRVRSSLSVSGQALEPAVSVRRRRARGPFGGLKRGFHQWWFAYAMLAPVAIVMGLLVFYPLVRGIMLSFTDADRFSIGNKYVAVELPLHRDPELQEHPLELRLPSRRRVLGDLDVRERVLPLHDRPRCSR